MDKLICALVQENFPPERIIPQAPMSRYTSFRVGGPADVLVQAASVAEVSAALRAAHEVDVPITIIGNGTNLLVRDGGIRGLVLQLAPEFSKIRRDGFSLEVDAGASIHAAARFACAEGLEGMAEISGIPGSIGGAALMNAGSYGREIGELITRVNGVSLKTCRPISIEQQDLCFTYRSSSLMGEDIVITGVRLSLRPGDTQAIAARMDELTRERREKQPLDYPSAGSTFKRPEGHFAAKLIDDCDLRGRTVGGAQVSTKHAGFIINTGNATAQDILTLMGEVTRVVRMSTGIILEPEVRVLGEEA